MGNDKENTQCFNTGFLLGIFFRGRGKIYCYANFFCYTIVFGPNFREEQKFSGGQTGAPCAPCGRKPEYLTFISFSFYTLKDFHLAATLTVFDTVVC